MDRAYLDTDASDEVVDVQVGRVVRWPRGLVIQPVDWVAYVAWFFGVSVRVGVDLLETNIQMKLLADLFFVDVDLAESLLYLFFFLGASGFLSSGNKNLASRIDFSGIFCQVCFRVFRILGCFPRGLNYQGLSEATHGVLAIILRGFFQLFFFDFHTIRMGEGESHFDEQIFTPVTKNI